MVDVPDLPSAGPVRVLAVAGSVAIGAFAVAAALAWRRQRRRDVAWAAAPLLLGTLSFVLGRHLHPAGHLIASVLTLAAALRNVVAFRGALRAASALAAVAWIVAVVAAGLIFR